MNIILASAEQTQANFFTTGFFGYGEKGDFQIGSIAHIIPPLLLICAIILLYRFRNFFKTWKHERTFRIIYAFVTMLVEMSYFWRLLYCGPGADSTDFMTKLPFQICQWTCIFSIFMMACEVKPLFDIDVFVSLTFGLVPFFYPDVIRTTGPAYYRYYQFWLEHMLPVFAVFYMIFVKGYKIDLKKIYMPFIYLFILAIPSAYFNLTVNGANYMYVGPTAHGASVAKVLNVNMFIAFLLFFIFAGLTFLADYGVFHLVGKQRAKHQQKASQSEENDPK